MCYDIKTSLETQLKRAKRFNDEKAIREIEQKLLPYLDLPAYHVSGFSHPRLIIYTNNTPEIPTVSRWGLVPHWVKDKEQFKKIWNSTLNARGETIFEKPAFRISAENNRCLLYLDGFYEHHHYKGKSYPFFIKHKNDEPLILAGLWSEWVDCESGEIVNTFSIVTTKGNSLLGKIHNNPKLNGPRMPLILSELSSEIWLQNINEKSGIETIQNIINPYSEKELEAYTVSKLRGNEYLGNVKDSSSNKVYPELVF